MIRSEQYPAEKHTVYTKDGYILTVYRIPAINNNMQQRNSNRKVVLFMHGTRFSNELFKKKKIFWIQVFQHDLLGVCILLCLVLDYNVGGSRPLSHPRLIHFIVYQHKKLSKFQNKLKNAFSKRIVLGMTSAAPAFFFRNSSTAYRFSDAGYDVWLGNARGNTYCKRHMTMHPSDPKFWEFSWHEIGIYDIPATIDYVLQYTNQTKLSYVGHSQGVTA